MSWLIHLLIKIFELLGIDDKTRVCAGQVDNYALHSSSISSSVCEET